VIYNISISKKHRKLGLFVYRANKIYQHAIN